MSSLFLVRICDSFLSVFRVGSFFIHVKNSAHFTELIKEAPIGSHQMVSLDVVSLFTKVPTSEALTVIQDKLAADPSIEERTCVPLPNLMEMLTFCMESSYFRMGNDVYRQEEGLAMGSPLSPVMANIYMEYFEDMALNSAPLRPTMWLRYVDDTFILWPHQEDIQVLLEHVNTIRPSIQFTMEKEKDNQLAFLDILITRTECGFKTSVYHKPTFTGQYLNFDSHHPYSVKHGIARCLQHRAQTISSDSHTYHQEMTRLRNTLRRNNYPDSILSTRKMNRVSEESETQKPPTVCLPYIRGVSERIQKICAPYNIRTVFKSESTLRRHLVRVKPPTEKNQTKNCIYSIPCSCSKVYKGKTCRPLKVRVEEHRKAVTRGETDKSGIAYHVWKEKGDHRPLWDEVKIINSEPHWKVRKLKETAHMLGHNNLLSRPSIELNTIWEPLIVRENLQ